MTARHGGAVRPRWGRIGATLASVVVTTVALVAAVGGLGSGPDAAAAKDTAPAAPSGAATSSPTPDPGTVLPSDSGEGTRAVFSQSRQRVWIVGADDTVERTYLVSGSLTDNLDPGTYTVYSRSRRAIGVDDSGVMQYFVRFTRGPSGAAIGFHSIPTKHGVPLQGVSQLGTPQSHGCIRQQTADAIAMWHFAQLGTKVVVTA